jgi:hypothetical protein
MATSLSVTSTYAGEAAYPYISAALLSPKTLDNITVKENIKHKMVVKKGADTVSFQNAGTSNCDFEDSGTITVTERILAPERFKVQREVCKTEFASDWEAIQMGYSAHNDGGAPNFNDWLIGQLAGGAGAKLESLIWTGVNATAGEFDGFEVLMLADSDVNDVTAAAFTSSNIDEAIQTTIDALPTAVQGSENLRIYMNTSAVWKYKQFLAAGGYANVYNTPDIPLNYLGVPVAECPGMSDNVLIVAEADNLWFGTGLLSDWNEVRLIDTSETLGDDNLRFSMKFTAGVQYGIGGDIAACNLS